MADFVSGINPVTPSYPVKPVQPVNKDRDQKNPPGKRQTPDGDRKNNDEHDPDGKPTIDEHV